MVTIQPQHFLLSLLKVFSTVVGFMHIRKLLFFFILIVFFMFSSTNCLLAFDHLAGIWQLIDISRKKTTIYVTQGTNGDILSISGNIWMPYGDYGFIKTNSWIAYATGEDFIWPLIITTKDDWFFLYRDGPFPIRCRVSIEAGDDDGALFNFSSDDGRFPDLTSTGGPIRLNRRGRYPLVPNGPPPPGPNPNDPPPYLGGNVGSGGGNSAGGSGGNPPPKCDPTSPPPTPTLGRCPASNGTLQAKRPGSPGPVNVADPVNIVSGNFFFPVLDLTLKSRLPLKVIRSYNSIDTFVTSFGRGWASPYTSHLRIQDDCVVFVNSDGSQIKFEGSDNNYSTPDGHDVKLTHSDDTGLWSLALPQGSEWFFNEDGKIIRMVRACCGAGAFDAIEFEYDSDGNLSKVSNPAGQWLQFSITDELITSITDSSGRSISYEYNSDKALTKFTDPIGRVINYTYDEDGFMTKVVKPGNLVTSIQYTDERVTKVINPQGAETTFAWNTANKNLTLTDTNGINRVYTLDDDNQLSSYSIPVINLSKSVSYSDCYISGVTDSLGNSSSYQYDDNGYLTRITDKSGFVTDYEWEPTLRNLTKKTDAFGRVWSYEWCYRGNLMKEIDPAGNETTYTYDAHNNRTSKTDALGHVTRYVYDPTGNYLTQTIDAMGGISSFTYDLQGNMISSTDQLGRVTIYEYDLIDRLVKSTFPDGRFTQINYDVAGNIASRVDNLGRVTAYTYDANGKLLTTTRPDGTVLAHAYDAAGRKISSNDALGRLTAYEYDALDNMVKVTYPDQTYQTYAYDTEKRLVSSTDELGNVTAYEYDPMGRMLATIDPAGSRYENQYDAAGRKIAAKDPLGRITAYEYDVLDRVVKTTAPDSTTNTSNYDALGNLIVSTNALNQQTMFEYDALNRQVKTTRADGPEFITVYDAVGQVISETDALGNTTANAYDNAGRRVSTTNALNHVWKYDYDNAGRLVKTTDPMGGVVTMTHDVMDRVVAESDALGRRTAYEYDLTGKRIARTDAMGRRSIFAYDLRDRLTTEVDGSGRIVSYGYDNAGRKTSLTDGAGRVWRWSYGSLGRVTAETDPLGNQVKSSYDAVGNLTLKTNARSQATGYEYDLMNRLVKVNYPDSTEATFAYDALGREIIRSGTAETVTKAYDVAGSLISEKFVNQNKGWTYCFDLMGNRVQAVSPENETFKYKYDNLYRLVELDTGKASEKIAYSYDALGRNIEEKRVDSTTANTFDAASQLLEMKHYSNADANKILALRQYSYDLAGNRINMTDENGKVTAYSYDNSNWLTQVVYPNADVVAYTYNDAGDRLTEKLNQDDAINYSYDAAGRMLTKGEDIFTYDADGNMLTDNLATYTWNADNRLVKVETTGKGCKHYKYQGNGYGHLKHGDGVTVHEEYGYLPNDWRRVSRKIIHIIPQKNGKNSSNVESAEVFFSVFDGNDESHEYKVLNSDNESSMSLELERSYISGPGTDDIEYTRYGVTSLAMLKDGLGSIIALIGPEAQAIAQVGYDAWGNMQWEGKESGAPCSEHELGSYLEQIGASRNFGKQAHDSWNFGRQFASELSPYRVYRKTLL
jgi:YD repeat-containing protein